VKHLFSLLPAAGVFGLALLVRLIYNLTVGKHYLIEYNVLLAGGMLWWYLGTGPGTLRALRRKQPTGG
jgi:hypothetical protein